jgi:hypothetical protein
MKMIGMSSLLELPYYATLGKSVTAIPVTLPILDRKLRWWKGIDIFAI